MWCVDVWKISYVAWVNLLLRSHYTSPSWFQLVSFVLVQYTVLPRWLPPIIILCLRVWFDFVFVLLSFDRWRWQSSPDVSVRQWITTSQPWNTCCHFTSSAKGCYVKWNTNVRTKLSEGVWTNTGWTSVTEPITYGDVGWYQITTHCK